MYGKPAMTCFKYQVYLYGSEAITYLSAILWEVTEPALGVIRLPPTPHCRQPSPRCLAAYPSPIWKRTLAWLNYHTYVKNQRENLNGRGTITYETTIPEPHV